MSESIYAVIEYLIFSLYLVFIFFSVQIWFLWKDIDKDDLKFRYFASESFFKKNSIYILSISSFLMMHQFEFVSEYYFEFFNLLALLSIVLFTYNWYSTLKPHAHRKILPRELNAENETQLKT